jgi:hypothetical protein
MDGIYQAFLLPGLEKFKSLVEEGSSGSDIVNPFRIHLRLAVRPGLVAILHLPSLCAVKWQIYLQNLAESAETEDEKQNFVADGKVGSCQERER